MNGSEPTMAALDVLAGEWEVEAQFPGASPLGGGRSVFEWGLAGTVLIQRTEVPEPETPDSLVVVSPDGTSGGYLQHYFDSRGAVRVYAMTFVDRLWRLARNAADFSELAFQHRFEATVSGDGNVIRGTWEHSDNGADWVHDFTLTYRRANR